MKVFERISGVKSFLGDVAGEMRKATWPERQELIESTAVVVVSVLLLSAFVGISDKVLVTFLKLITPSG